MSHPGLAGHPARRRGRPQPLAGASLTSRAVSESARLALAWHALLLAPELAKHPKHPPAPDAKKTAGGEP